MKNKLLSLWSGVFRKKENLKNRFTEIYKKNLFNGGDSISGQGSDMFQTRIISVEIPKLLKKLNVKTFLDAPCGDFFWMQHVDLSGIDYVGLDIVDELVANNNQQFGNDSRKFVCKNIVNDLLPMGELIMIRDCWVHLSNANVLASVENLKRSKVTYLLTTSFPNIKSNPDLTGIWRPINLTLPPFNFPQPMEIITEGCTENEGRYADKSLMLWKISDLPTFD
ncbi:MAG: hypothetical protein ACK478_04520 [Flavobacteriales bacterium]|jgi:hypothetical protein